MVIKIDTNWILSMLIAGGKCKFMSQVLMTHTVKVQYKTSRFLPHSFYISFHLSVCRSRKEDLPFSSLSQYNLDGNKSVHLTNYCSRNNIYGEEDKNIARKTC